MIQQQQRHHYHPYNCSRMIDIMLYGTCIIATTTNTRIWKKLLLCYHRISIDESNNNNNYTRISSQYNITNNKKKKRSSSFIIIIIIRYLVLLLLLLSNILHNIAVAVVVAQSSDSTNSNNNYRFHPETDVPKRCTIPPYNNNNDESNSSHQQQQQYLVNLPNGYCPLVGSTSTSNEFPSKTDTNYYNNIIHQLAIEYAPVLFFHPLERYPMQSIETLLEQPGTIRTMNNDNNNPILDTTINPTTLLRTTRDYQFNNNIGRIFLDSSSIYIQRNDTTTIIKSNITYDDKEGKNETTTTTPTSTSTEEQSEQTQQIREKQLQYIAGATFNISGYSNANIYYNAYEMYIGENTTTTSTTTVLVFNYYMFYPMSGFANIGMVRVDENDDTKLNWNQFVAPPYGTYDSQWQSISIMACRSTIPTIPIAVRYSQYVTKNHITDCTIGQCTLYKDTNHPVGFVALEHHSIYPTSSYSVVLSDIQSDLRLFRVQGTYVVDRTSFLNDTTTDITNTTSPTPPRYRLFYPSTTNVIRHREINEITLPPTNSSNITDNNNEEGQQYYWNGYAGYYGSTVVDITKSLQLLQNSTTNNPYLPYNLVWDDINCINDNQTSYVACPTDDVIINYIRQMLGYTRPNDILIRLLRNSQMIRSMLALYPPNLSPRGPRYDPAYSEWITTTRNVPLYNNFRNRSLSIDEICSMILDRINQTQTELDNENEIPYVEVVALDKHIEYLIYFCVACMIINIIVFTIQECIRSKKPILTFKNLNNNNSTNNNTSNNGTSMTRTTSNNNFYNIPRLSHVKKDHQHGNLHPIQQQQQQSDHEPSESQEEVSDHQAHQPSTSVSSSPGAVTEGQDTPTLTRTSHDDQYDDEDTATNKSPTKQQSDVTTNRNNQAHDDETERTDNDNQCHPQEAFRDEMSSHTESNLQIQLQERQDNIDNERVVENSLAEEAVTTNTTAEYSTVLNPPGRRFRAFSFRPTILYTLYYVITMIGVAFFLAGHEALQGIITKYLPGSNHFQRIILNFAILLIIIDTVFLIFMWLPTYHVQTLIMVSYYESIGDYKEATKLLSSRGSTISKITGLPGFRFFHAIMFSSVMFSAAMVVFGCFNIGIAYALGQVCNSVVGIVNDVCITWNIIGTINLPCGIEFEQFCNDFNNYEIVISLWGSFIVIAGHYYLISSAGAATVWFLRVQGMLLLLPSRKNPTLRKIAQSIPSVES